MPTRRRTWAFGFAWAAVRMPENAGHRTFGVPVRPFGASFRATKLLILHTLCG
jgi:hypothetical protein